MLINMAYSVGVQPVYGMVDWIEGTSYGIVIGAYAIQLAGFGLGMLVFKCLKEKKLREMFENNK